MSAKQSRTVEKPNDRIKTIADISVVIILAIIVASVINGAVFTSTRVSGNSMDDTLYGGGNADVSQTTFFDKLFFGSPDNFGDKVIMVRTQKVERGDIVVFHPYENSSTQYIKRVIAVAGDKITLKNGEVWLNGEKQNEDYVKGETWFFNSVEVKTWVIPEGCVFVMGDNREDSTDSRIIGSVKTSSIVGRVVMVLKKDSKKLVLAKNL